MKLFSCSDDLSLVAWNTRSLQAERGMVGHTGAVGCLVAGSGLLFSGAEDHSILVWGSAAGSRASPCPSTPDLG